MKEQTIEVTKYYNIKTDGKYCYYEIKYDTIFDGGRFCVGKVVTKCYFLDKQKLYCDLFDKYLKRTKTEKIKRCKECLSAKIIN